jgi:hypothetical protein|uniref:Uncharacterized protein n=1 Tax=Candidatus Aramenus sulfurataquae TaxID=1326980 RepID=A0AAE3FNN8_9CREN|nr:hypothetical protein [Candidatus Aramenus sulfurataquae]
MTLQAVEISQGQIYLPLLSNQQPDGLFIRSISFYDISQSIYNVSYSVEYGSLIQSFSAFVAYPQVVTVETSGLAYTIFDTEEIIDEKYFSMIPPLLIEFYKQQLTYKQVSTLTAVAYVNLVYYNDDVLFLLGVPSGVVIYSLNTGRFYNVKLPTVSLSQQSVTVGVTFLGGHIVGAISEQSGNTISVTLLDATFTYSDTVFTIVNVYTIDIAGELNYYTINIVGNTSYAVVVVRYNYEASLSNPSVSQIYYIIYDMTSGSSTTYASSQFSNVDLFTGVTTISSISFTIGIKIVSIYAYYVFTVLYDDETGNEIIVSFNLKTLNIETIEIPLPNTQWQVVLQKNYVILLTTPQQVIQQGNVYFLPVNYQIYEITTSEMLTVQFYTVALEQNNLVISGKVLYVQTGQPASNATVGVYYASSAMGNQLAISSLIGQVTTDQNGEFQFSYQFNNAPPDLDLVVAVSVDPIVLNYIPVRPKTISGGTY